MHLRRLTPDDAPAFREIRAEMCTRHPEAFGDTPEEIAATPDDTILLWVTPVDTCPQNFILGAFDEDTSGRERLLGTVAFRREGGFKERHICLIWAVYLREEGRGRGLARKMMEMVIEECRRIDGLEKLVLSVALPQTAARTLYTSLGFYTTGFNREGYKLADGRYVDHEEMVLCL